MADQDDPVDVVPGGQAVRKRPSIGWIRWTRAMKDAFLDHLAGEGNVTAAARAIGLDPRNVHALRRRDAAFATEWEIALDAGYMMIETRLIGHVLAGLSRNTPLAAEGDVADAVDFEDAVRLLALRDARHARQRRGNLPVGGRAARAEAEETDAAILRKLRAWAPSVLAPSDQVA